MNFDRPRTDPEVIGDCLVGKAANQSFKNVMFARSQHIKTQHSLGCARLAPVGPLYLRKAFFERCQKDSLF